MTRLPIFMLTAILVWAIAEAYGIATQHTINTFSGIWWWLRDERVTRFAIWGLFTWAAFHLMLQRPGQDNKVPHGWRDVLAISVGLVIATAETLWPRMR